MAQGIQPTSYVSKSTKAVTTNKKRKQSIEAAQDVIATIPAMSVNNAKVTAVPTAAKRKRRRKSAPTQSSTSTTTHASPVPIPGTNTTSRRRRSNAPDVVDINIDNNNYSTSSAVLGAEEEEDGVVASPSDKMQPDTTATDAQDIPAPVCAGVGEVYRVTTTTDEEDEEEEDDDKEEVGMMFNYENIFDDDMLE